MARVVVLTCNTDVRQGMLQAVVGIRPIFCDNEESLLRATQRGVCDAIIIGLRTPGGQPELALIRRMRERYPMVWLIGCLEGERTRREEVQMAATAARAGASEIIVDDLESYTRLYDRIGVAAVELTVLHRVSQAIGERIIPTVVQQFIEHGVLHARRAVSVETIAAGIGISRQTIARRCRHAGLPNPERLVSWSRLLFAAAILEQPGMTADQVGYRLFGSPSAFRKMLHAYVGVQPGRLRQQGGLELMLAEFVKVLDRAY